MLRRKTVILAKAETTYGTDPVPTVAANTLEVYDAELKPNGETLSRNTMQASISKPAFVRGIKFYDLSFKTELKGTGTRGVLPAFGWLGTLFRGCGMSETIAAGTSIIYAPVSTTFESITIYVYMDGIFHKLLGCKGSFKIVAQTGKYLEVQWKFSGLYAAPTDASPAAQTRSSVLPVPVLAAAFSVGAYSGIIDKLELDIGNTIAQRKSMNAATGLVGFEITDRNPVGSFDPEVVTEATYAFWNKWETAAQQALNLGPIGSTSGNIVQIAAPKVQPSDMSYGDRDGNLIYQIPIALSQNAGDDELTITIT